MSNDPLWDRWRRLDAVTWHGAATEDAAFEAWYECHRHLVSDRKPEDRRFIAKLHYTNCQDIKDFHKTVTGQRFHAIYVFNTRLLNFLKRPDRPIRRWLWFFSWLYRRYLVETGQAPSTLLSEIEAARQREIARARDAAALGGIFAHLPSETEQNLQEVIEAEFTNDL